MRKRRLLLGIVCTFLLFIVLSTLSVLFSGVLSLPDQMNITYSDLESINENNIFGDLVNAELKGETKSGSGEKSTFAKLVFKLFGFVPIRAINVDITDAGSFYLGGVPLGFSLESDGLIVLGSSNIKTQDGMKNTGAENLLQKGDIITEINGVKVKTANEIKTMLKEISSEDLKPLKMKVLRNAEEISFELLPALDSESGEYRIGVWVRSDASGVGTLTFVKSEDKRFGALGHPITDFETGCIVPASDGQVFSCNVLGLNKGEKGTPGELKGVFMQGKKNKGNVDKNTSFGVFGNLTDCDGIIDVNKTANAGSRLSVKPGKATLVSAISGVRQEYEIEIIKANYQPSESDKSFVFRVTDKKLLDLTGGIIQGMSGSPILQNGKIVGAVTHVFVSDPTKGYGIYMDWMLNK